MWREDPVRYALFAYGVGTLCAAFTRASHYDDAVETTNSANGARKGTVVALSMAPPLISPMLLLLYAVAKVSPMLLLR